MKGFLKSGVICCLLLCAAGAARAQSGIVCGNPQDAGCQPQYQFEPHDLGFLTGRAQLGTGTRHESAEFYAVILESRAAAGRRGCNYIGESKRRAVQKMFPANKAFTSRNVCRGTVVLYENVDNDYNFLAVYGGETEDEARAILDRAKRRYPQANIRKMRVVLDFADE